MNSYAGLYPYMMTRLNSCPQPVVMQELHVAGKEFCERSEAWEYVVPAITPVAAQTDYIMNVPFDALIKRIKLIWAGSQPAISDVFGIPNTATMFTPDMYDLIPDTTLTLTRAPTSGTDLAPMHVTLVLVPRIETNEFDEDFFERWAMRGIMALAMSSLMAMKDRAWSDPAQAQTYFNQYRASINEAKSNKTRHNKGGDQRVFFRRFV